MHPLDIARKKYFFVDDSTPSCRLLEDVDDCGNEITEPDLWRPLGMDTKTYNAKIEKAKKSTTANTIKQGIKGYNSQEDQTVQGDFSVQCAQREPISRELCKYREFLPGIKEKDDIIDLTSPVTYMSTTWNRAKTCYSPMRTSNHVIAESSSHQHKKMAFKKCDTVFQLFVT